MLSSIVLLTVFCIQPIEKAGYKDTSYFKQTINNIDHANILSTTKMTLGWSKVNLTPKKVSRLAGYTYRNEYSEVKDSVYVGCYYFNTEKGDFLILHYDLLLINESLRSAIEKSVFNNFPDVKNIYYTCSHAHSSFGGWAKGLLSWFVLGGYDEDIVNDLLDNTQKAIAEAKKSVSSCQAYCQNLSLPQHLHNRVAPGEYFDNKLRTIFFKNELDKLSSLTSFGGHPTLIPFRASYLSGDYPSIGARRIERNLKANTSFFCGGAIGSTSIEHAIQDHKFATDFGNFLADTVSQNYSDSLFNHVEQLKFTEIQVELPPTQFKLNQTISLRPFLSQWLFGTPKTKISLLQLNNILLIGFPGEVSGEVFEEVKKQIPHKNLMLYPTSFNGDYIGYLSHSKHYYSNENFETRDMNIYGPHNSDYITEITVKILNNFIKQTDLED